MFKTTFQNILLFDFISAFLMLVSWAFLLSGYFSLDSLGPIQKASGNADVVKWIYLVGSIISFVLLLFYVFCVFNWFALRTKGKFGIIAELIYILGMYTLEEKTNEKADEEEKKSIGEEVFNLKSKSETASVESLYGFGHTEDQKWTFSGKKPKPPNSI